MNHALLHPTMHGVVGSDTFNMTMARMVLLIKSSGGSRVMLVVQEERWR